MLFRFLFPYFFLALIVMGYIYFRYYRLGPVLLKVKRKFFSRYNNDSFLLIAILGAASYFLLRFELDNAYQVEEMLFLGPYTYVFFYGALMLAVIAREAENPALREKGFSTPRGFFKWAEVETFRWSKDVITVVINRGRRKRSESWQVDLSQKKEIDQLLRQLTPKRNKNKKKS